MAPDSHVNTPGSADPSAIMAVMALTTSSPISASSLQSAQSTHNGQTSPHHSANSLSSHVPGTLLPDHVPSNRSPARVSAGPLPNGILFKGSKIPKRVTFRDSHLVNIRIIPPRSSCGSSSEDEDDDVGGNDDDESDDDNDDEDEDDTGSSDSEEDSDDSEDDDDQEGKGRVKMVTKSVTTYRDRTTTITRLTSSPQYTTTSPVSSPRRDRAPGGPWNPASPAKGSYSVTNSPASRVVALVSHITGVTSGATYNHLRHRGGGTAAAASSKASSAVATATTAPAKRSPVSARAEKKVKKITPTLDNVMTSQTVRSVQKHGAVVDSLHRGNSGTGVNKTVKKKRVVQSIRRQEGVDRRGKASTPRKPKDTKTTGGVNVKINGRGKAVNGVNGEKDTLTLPPLAQEGENTPVPTPKLTCSPRPVPRTPIFTVDGFIFPGDPAQDLAAGVKAMDPDAGDSIEEEDMKQRSGSSHRVGSSTPGSAGRRRRYYAWQMANGNLQSSLKESPCITPMWETVTPVASLAAKTSSSFTDR